MRNIENDHFPCTHTKACHVLWGVYVEGWSQTKTALVFDLNVGTVNHIVRKKRFASAVPLPPNDTAIH